MHKGQDQVNFVEVYMQFANVKFCNYIKSSSKHRLMSYIFRIFQKLFPQGIYI